MSIVSNTDSHMVFARALASPDKEIRDKTVTSLINYVSSLQEISEMEMLKLWKALYYCMWLSDKAPIQMELATALSGLFRSFKQRKFAILYYRMFFRTMVREWSALDQHRINKFYTLIRVMLREGFAFMHKKGWDEKHVEALLDVLEEELLVKTPNGLRLHVADIFLKELWVASQGDINTDAFLRVLGPFFRAVQGTLDISFQERVSKKVFSAFVKDFAREHSRGIVDDDDEDAQQQQMFLKVQTSAVQGMIFSMASDSDTVEKNRRKLYLLHQDFPPVTGQAFASMDDEEEEEEEEVVPVKKIEKKIKSSDNGSSKVKEVVLTSKKVEEQKSEKVKDSKKRKADTEQSGDIQEGSQKQHSKVADKKEKVEEVKKDAVKTSKPKALETEVAVKSDKSEKKRKAEVLSKPQVSIEAPLPVANMVAIPSAPVRTEQAAAVAASAPFISSKRFTGGKLGYVFKKGKTGLGYYQDAVQMRKQAKVMKKQQVKAPVPVSTTPIVVNSSSESSKKSKKEKEQRRASGEFPPADSVRIDDIASSLENEAEKAERKVRFGKPQSKGYTDSIASLKSGASPHASLTPSHSALKAQNSAIKSGLGSGKKILGSGGKKKGDSGSKASTKFLAGRAN